MRICIDCRKVCEKSPCNKCRSKRNQLRDAKRGTTTERGYGAEYQRLRKELLADNPPCYWCGKPATTADHAIPLALGGANIKTNLVPSCGKCNFGRTANLRMEK